jgi:hypothetical protein
MKMSRKKPTNPSTLAEWQEAVNGAYFYLLIDSAKQYGLITHNMQINIERCEEIIRLGKEQGIKPQEELFR